MKGVKKAYKDNPPTTGQLPQFFAGSTFNPNLDAREVPKEPSHKALLQPPPTGKLPEFFNGVRELPDSPEIELVAGQHIRAHTIQAAKTFIEGKKNTRRNRSGTLSFHKKSITGRR